MIISWMRLERPMRLVMSEWLISDDEFDEVCEAEEVSEVRQADK